MKPNLWAGMLAILLLAGPSTGWSQRGVINPATNYDDLSRRDTRSSERDEKKKADAKKAEDAKRKADEQAKRDERQKANEERRNNDNKDDKKPADAGKTAAAARTAGGSPTSGTGAARTAQGGNVGKAAGKGPRQPGGAGGTTDPTTREVTEVMLDAVRTQTVNFDVEAARNDPGMIMLNAPKLTPKNRVRAGDASIAQPL